MARLYGYYTEIISIYFTTACIYSVYILHNMSNELNWYMKTKRNVKMVSEQNSDKNSTENVKIPSSYKT